MLKIIEEEIPEIYVSSRLRTEQKAVSYTHLTLPTKA